MKKLLSFLLVASIAVSMAQAQVFDEPDDSPYYIVDGQGNVYDPDQLGPDAGRGPGGPPAPIDDYIPLLAVAGAALGFYYRYKNAKMISKSKSVVQ